MLEVINYNSDKYDYPALVVLGCFDALHVGHAELLKKAKLQAKINGLDLGIMMFSEGKGGRQVFTFEERLEMLAPYNTKFVLKIDYNEKFKSMSPLDFLGVLEEYINVKGYMSGKDFRFGARAKGKSSTLKNYADNEDNAVWYMPVKDLLVDGEKVSTTLIKQYLEEGKIQQANKLLGREYFITGTVCRGNGRGGSELGFPTANITYPEDKVLVAEGVYGVEVSVDGESYQGVANFGGRPTFGEQSPVLEAFLDGFSGDLYGKTVTLKFLNCIRSTIAFENKEALSAQISDDLGKIGFPDADPLAAAVLYEAAKPAEEETVATPVEALEEVASDEDADVPVATDTEPVGETPYEVVEEVASAEEVSEPVLGDTEPVEETPYEVIEEVASAEEVAEPVLADTEPVEETPCEIFEETAATNPESETVAEEYGADEEDANQPAQSAEVAKYTSSIEDGEVDFSKELKNVDDEIAAIEAELYGISNTDEDIYGSNDIVENEPECSADESIFSDGKDEEKDD